jgi:signal transduction histidine kinase
LQLMKNREKPVFKLTIVFILAVFISAGILTYLSISNISNLKELTEKKISEEERIFAEELTRNFHKVLEEVCDTFTEHFKSNPVDVKLFTSSQKPDFINDRFIIDRRGNFLWPFFIEGATFEPGKFDSGKFTIQYNRAENLEFNTQKLNEAEKAYRSALRFAISKYDSALCFNALARISVKINNRDKAIELYNTVISKYYSVTDKYKFPFVYYAIPQLINISDSDNTERIIKMMEQCLAGMASGEIPLNYSTGDILDQIGKWMEQIPGDSNVSVQAVNELIQEIKIQLTFIFEYGSLIRKYGIIDDSESLAELGDYYIISGVTQNPGMAIFVNHKHENLLGFTVTLDRLWGMTLDNIKWNDTEFEYLVELTKNSNSNSPFNGLETKTPLSLFFPSYVIQIKLKDESLIKKYVSRRSWIYGIALTLLIGGMIMGVNLILRDINREKRMAARQSEFIANITHELKTPLTSINMFAESIYLDRAKSETSRKKYSYIIIKESENLKRKIDNILEYSVKKNERSKYKFQETELSALLKSVLNEMEYWLEINKFNVSSEIEDGIFAVVDPEAIKQALSNLIGNAIKYSPVSKNLYIRLKKQTEKIIIEVEDTGLGIPKDQINLIFEKFYRVRSEENKALSGTGIGLTVSRDIIKAHNGELSVTSELKKGSKFTIVLNS